MGYIGTDESGKGDYFGYLVVAAVYVDNEDKLKKLGVKDSKKITDLNIKKIAIQIKKYTKYSIVKISPEKYNKIYPKFDSLNYLLAWTHAKAIENLLKQVKTKEVIVDKFADSKILSDMVNEKLKSGQKLKLIQRIKAESNIAVAAASILARAEFLNTLRKLGRDIGTVLPKGATHVEEIAKEIVKKDGPKILKYIAKLHFKTTKRVIKY